MIKKNISKIGGVLIAIVLLMVSGAAYAGTITPPAGAPAAQFYTLSEIYNFITANTAATEGGHDFTFNGALAGSGRTLTEIYNALASLISADKLKLGTTYLNTSGTLVPSGGTAAATNVLSGQTFFGVSQADWNLQTGTMANNGNFSLTPGTADQAVAAGYYSGGTLSGDADLVSANIKTGITIFGVVGNSNVADTSSGDAVAGEIMASKKAWVDGAEITGTLPTQTLSASSTSVSAGYYAATDLATVDTDLAGANILSGANIFGVAGSASAGYAYGDSNSAYVLGTATGAGTALKNIFNGTGQSITGGAQAEGGIDDYNNNGARPADSYAKSWTTCNAGNSYCGTSDSGAAARDDSTGLIWSHTCNGSGTTCSPSSISSTYYTWANAKSACANMGWALPHQKQLLQAYIDGAWGNLETSVRSYWSGTSRSSFTTYAFKVDLAYGFMQQSDKTSIEYARCVR